MITLTRNLGLALAAVVALAGCSGSAGGTSGSAPGDTDAVHVKTGCDRFFFQGNNPEITKAGLAKGVKRLCYRSFAVAFSPISRTALWSAEVIDPTTVTYARKLPRHDEFHPEPRLAPKPGTPLADVERAELVDYRGSGYDRGHLAPSGDMPTADAQEESFSLANIVPQAPRLNRGSWAEMESDVRDQALDARRIYVVTGPVFNGHNIGVINRRVMIPSHVWKAILVVAKDGKVKGSTVYVASNTDYPVWKSMSVAQFADFSGINPFPGISAELAKLNMATGNTGDGSGKSGSNSGASGTSTQPWDPGNCKAPWRPTNDPHYGHCHPISNDEAQFGLVPETEGTSTATSWSTAPGQPGAAVAPGGGASWSQQGSADPNARLRERNRDRNRDRDR